MFKKLAGMLILVLLLAACQKNMLFEGESEGWAAKIEIMQSEDLQESKLILLYKGDSVDQVGGKKIKYQIKHNASLAKGTGILTSGGVVQIGLNSCRGCAFVFEEDQFDVTIELEGMEESLVLKYK